MTCVAPSLSPRLPVVFLPPHGDRCSLASRVRRISGGSRCARRSEGADGLSVKKKSP